MIDTFNLVNDNFSNQVFYVSSSGATSWQIWNKPKNINFIKIFVLGSGAGGGGGGTGNSTTARGGGGGGGTGAFATGIFPACALPDTLFVQVGKGGAGGAANTIGTSGELTYVSITSSATTESILMKSGTVAPTGGGGSNSTSGGAAGVAGTVWDYTLHIFPQVGHITVSAGQAGVVGGASSAIGPNVTITLPITGGAGGSGANAAGIWYAGNDIDGSGWVNSILGGKTVGANGSGGYMSNYPSSYLSSRRPILFTGGAGGAGQINGVGGFGGNAAFGSGGGGGGGTSTSNAGAGGSGGRGGDGLVIITCW